VSRRLRLLSTRADPMTRPPALVPALSLTMLISWGSLYYAFALLAKPIEADLHASAELTMGAYSAGLVAWGLCAYPAGRLMDRIGGRRSMALGSCLCGVLFAVWSVVESPWALYLVWAGLGVGMALTLYEPAFAVLVAADPAAYRRRMSILTLAGGCASTVFWPLTQLLADALGWRGTVQVYAAMHLLVCAPLHWLALPAGAPRAKAAPVAEGTTADPASLAFRQALRSSAFWGLALSFVAFGFVNAAMATHMVPMLQSTGVGLVFAMTIAALIGPMQVAGRSADLLLTGRVSSRTVGTIAVLLTPAALLVLWVAPMAPTLLYVFAVLYGAGLGLATIVRASAPLEVFGAAGYASVNGALHGPARLARAAGPLAGTFLFAIHQRYETVLAAMIACAAIGAASHLLVMRRSPR
jgi:MFS family permease